MRVPCLPCFQWRVTPVQQPREALLSSLYVRRSTDVGSLMSNPPTSERVTAPQPPPSSMVSCHRLTGRHTVWHTVLWRVWRAEGAAHAASATSVMRRITTDVGSPGKRGFLRGFCVVFLTLLQLLVVPATHLLHVNCGCESPTENHDRSVAVSVSKWLSHAWTCSCPVHTTSPREDRPAPAEPHDSDSCAVCRAAFATTTVSVCLTIPSSTTGWQPIALLSATPPDIAPGFRYLSRGPPSAGG